MDNSLEGAMYLAVVDEDNDAVSEYLSQGANPNKVTSCGKTCLGESARIGNTEILTLLIEATNATKHKVSNSRKRHTKSQKRKRCDGKQSETGIKFKHPGERTLKDCLYPSCDSSPTRLQDQDEGEGKDKNQGYFVFIHNEGSSGDEMSSRVPPIRSPLSPSSLTPSPQGDLEWDEEIGNVAPTTSEDETWSSMYKWYASILESTGAALASATSYNNGVDQQDTFTRTALHYAAETGHFATVKMLIDAGCKVDIASSDGLTPLHVASIRNHIEIAKALLAVGSQVNYKTHEKMTSLHFAASRGYLELAKTLVENGAYLEARDTSERTALFLAAGGGHIEVVKYLISVGANVNGEEIHGYTPLREAVWQGYAPVVKVLLNCGARVTHMHQLLHNAIIQAQVEIVVMLASISSGINLHNENGDTPLLLATRLSQPNIVKILLQKGANVNACNSITGANALHIAVESVDNAEVFEELLKSFLMHKIDVNATALTGDTALNRALLLHKDDAAKLLIRYGADVNTCDLHSCGLDNLAIASRRRSPSLAEMLLKAGHEMPITDPHSSVPKPGTTMAWLHQACRHPLTLSELCRIRIRSMSRHITLFMYISSLPLPKSLQKYLMMEFL